MPVRRIDLTEHQQSAEVWLTRLEREALGSVFKPTELDINHVHDTDDLYYLRPGSTVGSVEIGDLSVVIHPKIGIPQLLSLACYAVSQIKFQPEDFDFSEDIALPDVIGLALSAHAHRAFTAGLLHGYRTEEEALYGVRGRIRFEDQLRRRFGMAVPVEVRYDEFTEDILANQLVKAAVVRLGGMRLRSQKARIGLGWVAAMLDNVSLAEFPANNVPEVSFDRLNEHYKGVVALSRLVLQKSAFQSNRGRVRSPGFLMDMNQVFQEFVTVALREELRLSSATFGERTVDSLDVGGSIRLRPDLVWSRGRTCRFVGDAKYKNISERNVPESDLYQLLAYVTALDLPGGMLVYAEGEPVDRRTYAVRHSGKTMVVETLDISGDLDGVLARVRGIGDRVRAMAVGEGRGFPPSRE